MVRAPLDHHLVSPDPAALYMGALPPTWGHVPARVVVNLCGIYPSGNANRRVVHTLPLLDLLEEEAMPQRATVESFLDGVHAYAAHEPTYWHCHAGLNRSGLAVAAYLHRYRAMRISDAIASLRERRSPMVLCNSLFERRLREWYGGEDEQEMEPFLRREGLYLFEP
ncbi:MAG: dual specificity protein phosphatase family protein [Myxococcota bacterium]